MKENVLNILALLEPALSSKYDDTWRKLKEISNFKNKPTGKLICCDYGSKRNY